jgi:hypothetical protein
MNTNETTAKMEEMKVKLSTLWIVIMFNMVFADILEFMLPGELEAMMTGTAAEFPITQEIMLVFAILLEIPIAMIILSRLLKYRANRWANIIASILTIIFVTAGGSTSFSYMFFAAVEVLCMLLIIGYAWSWKNPKGINNG